MHRNAGTLAVDSHEPIAAEIAQTRAHVQPARIGPVVQARVRDELLSGAETRAGMRARALAVGARWKPIVELLVSVHTCRANAASALFRRSARSTGRRSARDAARRRA